MSQKILRALHIKRHEVQKVVAGKCLNDKVDKSPAPDAERVHHFGGHDAGGEAKCSCGSIWTGALPIKLKLQKPAGDGDQRFLNICVGRLLKFLQLLPFMPLSPQKVFISCDDYGRKFLNV